MFGILANNQQICNPFEKDCIESISIDMNSNIFTKGFKYSATIRFKNESTSGKHKIEDCESLADAYIKAKTFVENL